MKPKYNIDDEVFVVERDILSKKIIQGVFAEHNKEWVKNDYRYSFKEFVYHFGYNTNSYGWRSEKEIFTTKEEYIATL